MLIIVVHKTDQYLPGDAMKGWLNRADVAGPLVVPEIPRAPARVLRVPLAKRMRIACVFLQT